MPGRDRTPVSRAPTPRSDGPRSDGQAPDRARRVAGPGGAGTAGHDSGRASLTAVEAAVLALQRDAGNRSAGELVATLQRAPRARAGGRVRMASGEAILGADALDAMLHGRAGQERLGDVPQHVRVQAEILLGAIAGTSPSGRTGITAPERLSLFDSSAPRLESVLDAALREAGGELEQATRARRRLRAIRTAWVKASAQEAVSDGRGVEFYSPRAAAERAKLAEIAKRGIAIYVRGEKFLGLTDPPGLTKDMRATRLKVLEGLLVLATVDDWPSWEKAVAKVDAQLARTDPDRMLGAGAAVLDQIKKATTFVTKSAEVMGLGMKSMLLARGMTAEAAVMSRSLEGIGKLSRALVVLDVMANAMILLDSQAATSKKIGAGLGFASGVSTLASTAGTAMGLEGTAAAAGATGSVLFGAAVTYESYKALAEYGYTSVVGGLSYVAIDEELEGETVIRERGRMRKGGLEPLGKAVSMHRARVEALERRLQDAAPRDRDGIASALNDELIRLQNALHVLRRRWASSPQPSIRDRLPPEDELAWKNAMTAGAEPFMVLDIASTWERALTGLFATKDEIVNETMHNTMKPRR